MIFFGKAVIFAAMVYLDLVGRAPDWRGNHGRTALTAVPNPYSDFFRTGTSMLVHSQTVTRRNRRALPARRRVRPVSDFGWRGRRGGRGSGQSLVPAAPDMPDILVEADGQPVATRSELLTRIERWPRSIPDFSVCPRIFPPGRD